MQKTYALVSSMGPLQAACALLASNDILSKTNQHRLRSRKAKEAQMQTTQTDCADESVEDQIGEVWCWNSRLQRHQNVYDKIAEELDHANRSCAGDCDQYNLLRQSETLTHVLYPATPHQKQRLQEFQDTTKVLIAKANSRLLSYHSVEQAIKCALQKQIAKAFGRQEGCMEAPEIRLHGVVLDHKRAIEVLIENFGQEIQQYITAERAQSTQRWEAKLQTLAEEGHAACLKQELEVQAKDAKIADLQQQLSKYAELDAQRKEADTDAADLLRVTPPDCSVHASSPADQAAYVPSLPWWDPASADDLDICALCVPCQLEEPMMLATPHHSSAEPALDPTDEKMQGGVKAENAHYAERREQATEALAACLKLELEAKQEQISLAEQRGKEAEDRLAGVRLEHARAQQQLQEFQGTIRDLTAQLQEADTAVADKPKVTTAKTSKQKKKKGKNQQVDQSKSLPGTAAPDVQIAAGPNPTAPSAQGLRMDGHVLRSPAVNLPSAGVLGEAREGHSPNSALGHEDARAKVVDIEESASSEGFPQPCAGTVQELKRQLAEAKQQADHDLATAERQHKKGLAEAQAATQKLQERCLRLEADLTGLQAASQLPCMPWGPQWQPRQEIGRGNNGVVFGAVNSDFPGTVLKRGRASNLRREGAKLWSLHHPNIVRAHAMITCQEKDENDYELAYLALDWQGPSLASLLATHPRAALTTRQVVVGFQGLFAGVAHMHRQGLVDQDLHAGNILLSPDRSALIKADLGNAVPKEVEGCPNWARAHHVAETFLEQWRYRPLFRSDVWALGLVMLEVVGGRKPEQHLDVLSRQDYLEELSYEERGDPSDPDEAPGQYRHLKYLSDKLTDAAQPDYADEVTFPPCLQGPLDSPEAELQSIIRGCLRVRSEDRSKSEAVSLKLHSMMLKYGWTSSMLDT